MTTTSFTQKTIFLVFISILFLSPIISSAQWTQLGFNIDGEAVGDLSGAQISLNASGNRIAIGAQENNGNGDNSGHVRIYEWIGTTWMQLGADIDGEAEGDQSGISVSMNAVGDRIAIGATENDGNGAEAGHVRIYEWNGTSWVQLGGDIDGEAAGDRSGYVSMNASGNRLAIGAGGNDGNGADAGHVRIYDWNGTAWNQLGADIDGEAAGDISAAVCMNAFGNKLAIGAFLNDGNGTDAGHVRVYEWNGLAWTQLGADIDGEYAGDESGRSISINSSGDRLVIGASKNSMNEIFSGHGRIYQWDGTSWTQLGADIDGVSRYNQLGWKVSMNAVGDRIAIGNATDKVRIYEWNATAWIQRGSDINGELIGDGSGWSISLDSIGDRIGIGAPFNSDNGRNAGHVRVYQNKPTDIVEIKREKLFSIYPNPANQEISLETKNKLGESVQITSITGAVLLEFNISKEQEKIDLSNFPNGLYFLKVGGQIQKVVISKKFN